MTKHAVAQEVSGEAGRRGAKSPGPGIWVGWPATKQGGSRRPTPAAASEPLPFPRAPRALPRQEKPWAAGKALPAFVVDELAATCTGKDRDELIWPAQDGGYLAPPTNKSWLAGAVERCQKADKTFPRVTAHDLRHTAASLAIASGANPKVVQRMLGHASAAMTLDVYADLFDSDFTAVADKLSETVGKMWARGQNDAV